jgi:predicted alpha/beta superfamily hydrolase
MTTLLTRADHPSVGDPWRPYRSPQPPGTVTGTLLTARLSMPALGATRDLLCLLPAAPPATDRRYPVLYLFDGQNLFDAATAYAGEWQVDEVMAALAAEGLEAIVIGVPNGGERRFHEYTPFESGHRHAQAAGGGAATLQTLVEVVQPLVEATLPVRQGPDASIIGGSSLGGLMGLWCAWTRPDRFGGVLAMSPAYPPGQSVLLERLARRPAPSVRVHLDTGGHEGNDLRADRVLPLWSRAFRRDVRRTRDALLAAGLRDGETLQYVEVADARHEEAAWTARLPDALRFLLRMPTSTG